MAREGTRSQTGNSKVGSLAQNAIGPRSYACLLTNGWMSAACFSCRRYRAGRQADKQAQGGQKSRHCEEGRQAYRSDQEKGTQEGEHREEGTQLRFARLIPCSAPLVPTSSRTYKPFRSRTLSRRRRRRSRRRSRRPTR
jgi:hypothetical protein